MPTPLGFYLSLSGLKEGPTLAGEGRRLKKVRGLHPHEAHFPFKAEIRHRWFGNHGTSSLSTEGVSGCLSSACFCGNHSV